MPQSSPPATSSLRPTALLPVCELPLHPAVQPVTARSPR
uniref:Uncharacterized protein n=1 Tax=Arundo donax TaxID=35708 RepID=A0A0A8YQ25_ARUDO